MAVADPITRPTASAPSPLASAVYAPRITANRRQIDDRFPSLGFSVDTGGKPFFEVLLTSDASLFDPANAAKRSAANFYTSRQDGGLLPAARAVHPFLVPSAVLRGFAVAAPRPRALFYTVIAYADKDGGSPAFAIDPANLVSRAPSVAVARDFTGNTLASVLSISSQDLRRFGGDNGSSAPPNPREDAGEGEDGYGAAPPASAPAPAPTAAAPVAAPVVAPAAHPQTLAQEGDFELAVLPAPASPAPSRRDRVAPPDPMLPGQVGNGAGGGRGMAVPMAIAQGADYGAESEEPEYLREDDDYESYGSQPATQAPAGQSLADVQLDQHPGNYQSLDEAAAVSAAARVLAVEDKMRIIDHVAPFESGGDYGAINADGEFEGRFGTSHPAYQRYHVGLSYGLIQFTQDSGKLGELMRSMHDRDPDTFAKCFGTDAGELLRVTNATGPASSESPGGRSARVQPVGGADLWKEPWVSRFRAAAGIEKFMAAQREVASRGYLEPMLEFAGRLGLDTERALTMVVDRAIQMGVGGAKHWIASAVGPVASDAQRQQALAALGYADLRSFQAATRGLAADGEWGSNTHAAMVAALRKLGAGSPIPIPTTDQMLEAMARRAASEPWHARVESLVRAAIPDVRYQL